MNLYKLSQSVNNGYDTFDSCVVLADTKEEARCIHPNGDKLWKNGKWYENRNGDEQPVEYNINDWVHNVKDIRVEFLGRANRDFLQTWSFHCNKYSNYPWRIVCASFNAGQDNARRRSYRMFPLRLWALSLSI